MAKTRKRPSTTKFAQGIRRARDASGMTQEEFAAALGVSRRTIQEWEAGNKRPLERYRAGVLAEAEALTSQSK